jgi:preprotein translocase subunit SecG
MKGILLFIQLISAMLLIVAVLLHSAKGEGLGGIGGQAKMFGSQKGLEEGLDKLTYGCAGTFLLVSFILSII